MYFLGPLLGQGSKAFRPVVLPRVQYCLPMILFTVQPPEKIRRYTCKAAYGSNSVSFQYFVVIEDCFATELSQ